MTVKVDREPKDFEMPHEHCCICEDGTPYWYTPKDVTLRPKCAKTIEDKDIPSKEEWFNNQSKRDMG